MSIASTTHPHHGAHLAALAPLMLSVLALAATHRGRTAISSHLRRFIPDVSSCCTFRHKVLPWTWGFACHYSHCNRLEYHMAVYEAREHRLRLESYGPVGSVRMDANECHVGWIWAKGEWRAESENATSDFALDLRPCRSSSRVLCQALAAGSRPTISFRYALRRHFCTVCMITLLFRSTGYVSALNASLL